MEGSLEVVNGLLFVEDLAVLERLFRVKDYPLQLLVAFHVLEVEMGHLCIYLHQNLAFIWSQRINLVFIYLL